MKAAQQIAFVGVAGKDRRFGSIKQVDTETFEASDAAVFTEEGRLGAELVIESTIFHEGTHYGDALSDHLPTQTSYEIKDGDSEYHTKHDPANGKIEGGKAFEKQVYGLDVSPSNATMYAKSLIDAGQAGSKASNTAPQSKPVGPAKEDGTF